LNPVHNAGEAMNNPQQVAQQLEQTFNHIHEHSMRGIPILNPNIRVEAVGFREHEGRVLGIIICPWLMNVVLLPREDEDWSTRQLGDKQPHEFSQRIYKFMFNEYEGIGACQTHSLYSPMRQFASHDQAVRAAQDFLDDLEVERELTEEERVDEELLGRVLREEDVSVEVNLDDFAEIEAVPRALPNAVGRQPGSVRVKETLSRRDLLLGRFRRESA
jgi:[NiFe] hydrogenase assembly HybE family chaperone